jgi:hypothetical protein
MHACVIPYEDRACADVAARRNLAAREIHANEPQMAGHCEDARQALAINHGVRTWAARDNGNVRAGRDDELRATEGEGVAGR